MKAYGVSVKGRLAKVRLSNPQLAVCEAIMNSIHSIEELGGDISKKEIKVDFLRSNQQSLMDGASQPDIVSLKIRDNGIGFTDSNYESFLTFDSTYKEKKGGKGIGRLTWLKFFETVSIASSYEDLASTEYCLRKFDFTENGIKEQPLEASKNETFTEISMLNLRNGSFPKGLETVGAHLLEHFLSYFATGAVPNITISDESDSLLLNDKFQKDFGNERFEIAFTHKDEKFKLTCLKVKNINTGNKVYMCAHKRVVSNSTIDLKKEYSLFKSKLKNTEGDGFFFVGFLESDYLDSHVNDNRTGFEFGEDTENADLISKIKMTEIKAVTVDKIKEKLNEELKRKKQENTNKVQSYINEKKPQFKYLMKHKANEIAEITAEDDIALYSDLRKVMFEFETESEKAAIEIIQSIDSSQDDDEFKRHQSELYEKVEDRKKISLAQYICDRRIILDILNRKLAINLSRTTKNKYDLEEAIHKLIFPLRKTSDDLNYDDQNLWIVDEKLCYHNYLASDLPMSKIEPLDVPDTDRPDLVIFDGPIAVTDSVNGFDSVVIIEFKRPGRDDYNSSDNPIDQVLNYILKIKEGSTKDRQGRVLTTPENVRFYCYILCDITPSLKPILSKFDAVRSPDGKGYYFYNKGTNSYIEILPFDKLLSDAVKRNQFLFEKLGIPST